MFEALGFEIRALVFNTPNVGKKSSLRIMGVTSWKHESVLSDVGTRTPCSHFLIG